MVPYNKLTKANPVANLNNAFNTAEDKLGITKLLDAEGMQPILLFRLLALPSQQYCVILCCDVFIVDVNVELPDEKSIITYVVTYYHYFNKMKAESVQGRRIGKVRIAAISRRSAYTER